MQRTTRLTVVLLAALIAACADTTRDRNVDYSGFLGDYSMLLQGFEMVSSPQADTLRVHVALTKLKESHVVLDVVSTVVPATLALSGLGKLVTGKPAFVGEAEIEVKAKDAMSGELLAAGVDHRVGGKFLQASHFSSWGEVEDMMRLWATHGSYNPCKLQARTDCVKPKS